MGFCAVKAFEGLIAIGRGMPLSLATETLDDRLGIIEFFPIVSDKKEAGNFSKVL